MAAIALFTGSLEVPASEERRLLALLAPDERARSERFRFARDRRRFVVRRARLRETLARVTGTRPARLRFVTGPFGKPELLGGPPFSLSHSNERWLLAVGDRPLGVDCEWIDPDLDWRPIARSLFRADECAALEYAGASGFFACWARKEAFVKALGHGLSYPLDAFAVSVGDEAALLAGGDGWRIAALPLGPDYAGALVAQDDGEPLSFRIADEAFA